ncbi:MAG: asparagine synthase (glutamine-hydrolyzing) [Thermoguttaceae bacterium]|nr:asparagine synthase (glutamine-hydrolyzing) [Thermoguttaceae bacterium]MDW8077584.1 asparagine synthase (glutamine-hydrolyzing) [Thermoguttaceae bacterium]
MCGIVGGVWTDSRQTISPPILREMVRLLCHRGPDDEGFFFWPPRSDGSTRGIHVALGHRRLAVIDLQGGKQPMGNEDGSVWVVFNGEIYNFRELRERLRQAGHRFATRSDTEVLLHLYEAEGIGMLSRLNGMFAFAIWDCREQLLLLARDRCGEKPLFYLPSEGGLFFASEVKALVRLPFFRAEISPRAIDLYLTYQYVPHPYTIYEGVYKLPPGHYLVWQSGRVRTDAFWTPDFQSEVNYPLKGASEQLRELLSDAVRLRLESDVPLGAFLSGGIDSTIVVGLMRQHAREPVHTFSIGFPVRAYDERNYARAASSYLGTVHHEYLVEPDAVAILPRLVWHYDEPFADSSAIPTWYLAEKTRQHVTVALTGDGGDELFAGYPRYWAVRLASWLDSLPAGGRRLGTRLLLKTLPHSARFKSPWRRLRRFLEQLELSPLERYLEWIGIFPTAIRMDLYTPGFAERVRGEDCYRAASFLEEAFLKADRRDPLTAIMITDLVTYLPCDLMTKVDIASMAHGLECRQPFLDHRVVEFATRLPLRLKILGFRGKRILRQTFRDLLPPPIRRRGKMGFGVPLDAWFRGPLRPLLKQVLLGQRLLGRGIFRQEAIERLMAEHWDQRRDHSARLWALLVLELWMQLWLDGKLQPLPKITSA